jgi:uncharacterized Zn-finger protein
MEKIHLLKSRCGLMAKRFSEMKCKLCKKVWRKATTLGHERHLKQRHVYLDIPSYGLKRKQCPTCKAEKKLIDYQSKKYGG